MEIIFIPKGISEDLMNCSLSELESEKLEEIKKELADLDSDYEIQDKNFGTGAEWIMILAILNGLTAVFLLGDKIDKGIEGWIKIGKRVKNIFSKSDHAYVDMDGAKLIGIEYLAEKMKIESIKVVMQSEVPIKDLSSMLTDRNSDDFIAKPFSLYLVTFEINGHFLITLGIQSDGKTQEHYRFDKDDYLPF